MQDVVLMGQKVRDKITGFEGIVIARAEHITGCDTCGVNPGKDKDGKLQTIEWFDYTRLEQVDDTRMILDTAVPRKNTGGPGQPHPDVR